MSASMAEGRRSDLVQKLMMMPDEAALLQQIIGTHCPDGREIDSKAFLQIIEEILYRSTPLVIQEAMQKKPVDLNNDTLELLPYIVNRLSSEMLHKYFADGDGHATALSLLQIVSSYPWDAKLVLLLVAFVLNYGEFWLLIDIHASSKLGRQIASLKQVPKVEILTRQLSTLNNLIKFMLDLAKCILEFKELTCESYDLLEVSTTPGVIPTAIYWAARGMVICAAHTKLTATNYEYPTLSLGTLEREITTLTDKIKGIKEHLQNQLALCNQAIEKKKENDAYKVLHDTTKMKHFDNMKFLTAFMSVDGDVPPLIEGFTKRMVNLEVLKRKYVLLLISGLIDTPSYELDKLSQIYKESKTYSGLITNSEIVWIPIVESLSMAEAMQQEFEKCLAAMPWLSVREPSFIPKPTKRFIREQFHYKNRPILVVLDPQGKVVNLNAFHMIWIWGSIGFPFTMQKEVVLWREGSWSLELLVNGVDGNIIEWIKSGKFIILYGGDDMQWINNFTATAHCVAQAGIPLEMVYVGKRGKSEQEMRPLIQTINEKQLSSCWQEAMIWFYWTRIESMLVSKIETNAEHDQVMQEIEKLLMYDNTGSWALFSRGSDVSLTAHGSAVLGALQKFDEWKKNVDRKGFHVALKEQYDKVHGADHPCCHLEFAITAGRIPVNMICPECHRSMEQYDVYSCCHDGR